MENVTLESSPRYMMSTYFANSSQILNILLAIQIKITSAGRYGL